MDRRTLLLSALGALPALGAPSLSRAAEAAFEVVEIESRTLGPRHLSIYRPPGWRSDLRYPVLYAADGQALNNGYAGLVDQLIREGRVPPMLMVGLWSAELRGVEDTRALEYLTGLEDDAGRAFRRHERYFLDEVMPFAEVRYGAATTRGGRLLFGWSNGAAWAASMGLKHSALFGQAALFSFGWRRAGDDADKPDRPRLFLAAGTREAHFQAETRRLYAKARRSPVEAVLRIAKGAHDDKLWRSLFPEAVTWAFGAARLTENGPDGL